MRPTSSDVASNAKAPAELIVGLREVSEYFLRSAAWTTDISADLFLTYMRYANVVHAAATFIEDIGSTEVPTCPHALPKKP